MTDSMLTHDGITQPITEWALDYGIYPSVIADRLTRGWTTEHAITAPMIVAPTQRLTPDHMPGLPRLSRTRQGRKRLYQHEGLALTRIELAKRIGVSPHTLRARLGLGMTMAESVAMGRLKAGRAGVAQNLAAPEGTGGGASRKIFPK